MTCPSKWQIAPGDPGALLKRSCSKLKVPLQVIMATAVEWVLEPVTGIPGALPQQVCSDKLGVCILTVPPHVQDQNKKKLAQLIRRF